MAQWRHEGRALLGWRVLVTRPAAQSAALVRPLAAAGAEPIELPLIEIGDAADGGEALRRAASQISSYEWVVLTSANGVERLLAEVPDASGLEALKVAAIGPATKATLQRHGIVAELVPPRYVGESLVEAFPSRAPGGTGSGRVLIATAAGARDVVPTGLSALGWQVEVVEAYETRRAGASPASLEAIARAHAVTFTSASALEAFIELAGLERLPNVVASIGPVTTAAALATGIAVQVEAVEHTVDGLVAALCTYARSHAPSLSAAQPP